jgi:hypothetical protein
MQMTIDPDFVHSWEELFQAFREEFIEKMESLMPMEAIGHYLEKVERHLRGIWPVGEKITAFQALPHGILFGDVLCKRFGCQWQWAKWTPGVLKADDIFQHAVVLTAKDGYKHCGAPMLRVAKFLADSASARMASLVTVREASSFP